MEHMGNIDPSLLAMMGKLAELTLPNAVTTVYTRIQAATAGKIDQKTVNELREIIDTLLAERSDLVTIARAFEEQLVSQRISDRDIKYIVNTVIPALKELADNMGSGDAEATKKLEDGIDQLTPLLSAEMLTVLQLVGFNFKRAIGEPLTLLIERLIASIRPASPQDAVELRRLDGEFSVELIKVAQNKAATDRWERLRDFRSSGS